MSLYGINIEDIWDLHISHQVTSHHITTHQLFTTLQLFFNHMHVSFFTPLHPRVMKKHQNMHQHVLHMHMSTLIKGEGQRASSGAGRRPPSSSPSPISSTLSHTHFQTRAPRSSLVASFKILASIYHS